MTDTMMPAASLADSLSIMAGVIGPTTSDFVPMIASHILAELLTRGRYRLVSHELSPREDLPGLLDNYTIRFEAGPRPA